MPKAVGKTKEAEVVDDVMAGSEPLDVEPVELPPEPVPERDTPEAPEAPVASRAVVMRTTKTLTVAQPRTGGALALASMSDQEFNAQLDSLIRMRSRMDMVMKNWLKPGVDYGVIPGTGDKPTILKPGVEALQKLFNLVPTFDRKVEYGDGVTTPQYTVLIECQMHAGDAAGPIVGVGGAAANSFEVKWRYRNAERHCPSCGKPCVIKGKEEYGGGWLCYAKKGGCGAKFPDGDASIEGQAIGKAENADPYDLLNTVVKQCEIRAKKNAVLDATASSGLLTQDLEELAAVGQTPQQTGSVTKPTPQQQPATQAPRPATARRKAGEGKPQPQATAPDGHALERARHLAGMLMSVHGLGPIDDNAIDAYLLERASFKAKDGGMVRPRSIESLAKSGQWIGRLVRELAEELEKVDAGEEATDGRPEQA